MFRGKEGEEDQSGPQYVVAAQFTAVPGYIPELSRGSVITRP